MHVFLVHSIAIKNIKKKLLFTLILHLFPEKSLPKSGAKFAFDKNFLLCFCCVCFSFSRRYNWVPVALSRNLSSRIKNQPPKSVQRCNGGVDVWRVNFSQMILVAFFLKFTWWDVRDQGRKNQGSPWDFSLCFTGVQEFVYINGYRIIPRP